MPPSTSLHPSHETCALDILSYTVIYPLLCLCSTFIFLSLSEYCSDLSSRSSMVPLSSKVWRTFLRRVGLGEQHTHTHTSICQPTNPTLPSIVCANHTNSLTDALYAPPTAYPPLILNCPSLESSSLRFLPEYVPCLAWFFAAQNSPHKDTQYVTSHS
jgi:hypothetical protein